MRANYSMFVETILVFEYLEKKIVDSYLVGFNNKKL